MAAGAAVAVEALPGLVGWLPLLVELRGYADPGWRCGRWADATILDYLDHLHTHQRLGLPRGVLDAHLRQDGGRWSCSTGSTSCSTPPSGAAWPRCPRLQAMVATLRHRLIRVAARLIRPARHAHPAPTTPATCAPRSSSSLAHAAEG
jgi:hypothetical protein